MKRCHRFGAVPRHCPDEPDRPALAKVPRTSEHDVAPPPRRPLLERAAGEGPISHAEGMARAYAQGHAYTHGDTTFVAGSHTARDWWDDATKVPFWGDLRDSERYQMAQKALKANPQATNAVGHSLGGSVVLEAQKRDPRLRTVTYGAPVWDPWGYDKQNYDMAKYRSRANRPDKPERYRNVLDPFSFFDGSAESHIPGLKDFGTLSGPHSYGTLAEKRFTGGTAATQNPDGSVSITE